MERLIGVIRSKDYLGWLLPGFTALVVILTLHFVFMAKGQPNEEDLRRHFSRTAPTAYTETVSGYQQIYYVFNDIKSYVTKGNVNHVSPVVSGQKIVWQEQVNGTPQMVLYDIYGKTRLQLTLVGVNHLQSVDNGRVVWINENRGRASVYLYDGTALQKISEEHASTRPSIDGERIIYAQVNESRKWQTVLYDLSNQTRSVITEGDESTAGYPRFKDGVIQTNNSR